MVSINIREKTPNRNACLWIHCCRSPPEPHTDLVLSCIRVSLRLQQAQRHTCCACRLSIYYCVAPNRILTGLQDYHWLGSHTLTTAATGPFTCTPFRKWIEQADTELIRYFDMAHVEYVIPVSDSALQELLTTKCYQFGKPWMIKTGTVLTVLGDGTSNAASWL
jgi:hypothetical protein